MEVMMVKFKVGGFKHWNNGWPGRRSLDRGIERVFRRTERAEIEAQLEEHALEHASVAPAP